MKEAVITSITKTDMRRAFIDPTNIKPGDNKNKQQQKFKDVTIHSQGRKVTAETLP